MSRKISLILSSEGVARVLQELQAYAQGLEKRVREFSRRLAELGAFEVEVNVSSLGELDVQHPVLEDISVVETPTGYQVKARGQDLLFVEYGTGVYYNGTESYPGTRPPEVFRIGEYGEGYGKRLRWFYQDEYTGEYVSTHGIESKHPVWDASMTMRDKIEEVAREVFADD